MPRDSPVVRIKKGCDTCRERKVKCVGTKPACQRCINARPRRDCVWPVEEPTLNVLRRGPGSWRSRARGGTLTFAPLLPESNSTAPPTTERPSAASQMLSITHAGTIMDPSTAFEGPWMALNPGNAENDWSEPSNFEDNYYSELSSTFSDPLGPESIEFLPSPEELHQYISVQWSLPRSPAMSAASTTLPNSMSLSPKERQALGHYQTTFSIYRTTKDPAWSTHKLLLDLGYESKMIMHFILAVSINDVCHRQEYEASIEAQGYFEIATQMLVKTVARDLSTDFVVVTAGFLFLYWYMPKKQSVPRERINQLSMTVLSYIKRHKLDSRCLESDDGNSATTLNDRDRSVLARLIIWTFDEDVKCKFQGYGGFLAAYLTAHRERTMAVYEVSRTALKAHWGSAYPDTQTDDDDDNAMELELLWALTALWQDINEMSHDQVSSGIEAHRRIKQRFSLLERKYAFVFQKSATTTQPRGRVLINADYDIVLFHALKVYYFRATISDSNMSELPADVETALKSMFDIIERTFASPSSDLHDRLQWPLFLVGIETRNGIYRNWILGNITSQRAKEALQKTIDHQHCSGKRLAMSVIKALLCESDPDPIYPVLVDHNSFLDAFVVEEL